PQSPIPNPRAPSPESRLPPHPMPTLKTITLGCKVNQYETEYVRQGLVRAGFRAAEPGEPVEWCLVNTCTVTATSDHKSRKAIRQLAREHPAARIIVMGCYATRAPDEAALLPGVVEVLTDKRRMDELLARFGVAEPPKGIQSFGPRHRAYVKVQDGCRMRCAYCIIPKTRPVLASRPVADVLAEVRELTSRGYREIVLTGIHLGHYGVDLEPACSTAALGREKSAPTAEGGRATRGPDLADLVEALARLDGDFRLRISSIEAAEATDRLLDVMAAHPRRVCPHLHLSMQSASDSVLRRMRRPNDHAAFVERCRAARARLDHPAISTDAIVGFPGETEADFQATCRAVEEIGFVKVHVFPFSPREGTEAASLPGAVPRAECHRRAADLAHVAAGARTAYLESLIGRKLRVLVEGTAPDRPGVVEGTSERYAPVRLSGGVELAGRLVEVTAERLADGCLAGRPWAGSSARHRPADTRP
ncbi:MAG: MiaB/RimO family radical SAM methylthiotransferase, partial [Pirellulales bacterium]|nr:MiaB/RimO family radical SAM methylthiotransferase [Pirellulales bacterium]